MLKIEDVKAGDKLECIDHDGYLDSVNENALDLTSIVIRGVDHNLSLFLTEGKGQGKSIKFSDIKYFKKKEQSQQYTFDDLIDVARKAFDDRVLLKFKQDTLVIYQGLFFFIEIASSQRLLWLRVQIHLLIILKLFNASTKKTL